MPNARMVRDGDGGPAVLQERDVRGALGPTSPVAASCHCARQFQPIHVVDATAAAIRQALEFYEQQTGQKAVLPDTVLGTYRCGRCKGVAQITARSVHLVAAS